MRKLFSLIVIFTKSEWLEHWEKNNSIPSWVDFIPVINYDLKPQIAPIIKETARSAESEYVAVVHQDVNLPAGWCSEVVKRIHQMNARDPNWGVLTTIGVTVFGQYAKSTTDFASRKLGVFPSPVISSEGVCYVIKKLYFDLIDDALPCIHFIDTDLILQLRDKDVRSYAIDLNMHHLISAKKGHLLIDESLEYMAEKWFGKMQFPFYTTYTWTYPPAILDHMPDTSSAWQNVSDALIFRAHFYINTDSLGADEVRNQVYAIEKYTTYPYFLYLVGNKKFPEFGYTQMTFEEFGKDRYSDRFIDVSKTKPTYGWLEARFGFRTHPIDGKAMIEAITKYNR